ncbi:hypothetical protein [Salinibacillus aidingensis]
MNFVLPAVKQKAGRTYTELIKLQEVRNMQYTIYELERLIREKRIK